MYPTCWQPNEGEIGKSANSENRPLYVNVARSRGATYFQVDDWDGLVDTVGEDNVWKVNEAFLQQQVAAGKAFILSHDPATATGYFLKEVNFLQNSGFRFVKDGSIWRAVK